MSPICPEIGVRSARCGVSDRARLPGRAPARSVLVCEVPAARWAPGPEEARAGVDRARPTAVGLLHEARRRRRGCGRCWTRRGGGCCRGRCGRAHVRRRRRRSGCASSRRTAAQAVDAARLPLGAARRIYCRRSAAWPVEIDHDRRTIERLAALADWAIEPQQEQAADPAARDLPAGSDGLGAPGQSAGSRREAPDAPERRHPGVLAGGGLGAGSGGRRPSRTGRSI